jgi:diaminopimelate epimerase
VKIEFYKYQGTGNDFIMLNNMLGKYDALTPKQIQLLCDRRFGIGADGLIKINVSSIPEVDFEVDYYNSDASKSFCGNGARCSVAFAIQQGIVSSETTFNAIDGIHAASKEGELIHLEMQDIDNVFHADSCSILDTGSPHYVWFEEDIEAIDIDKVGKTIRYSDAFWEEGINVNGVEILEKNHIKIKTYERGVEAETLSCGTGATACAIVFACKTNLVGQQIITVTVEGGELKVSFNRIHTEVFRTIKLIGPAEFVYKGEFNLKA